jgi:hypothetical protein
LELDYDLISLDLILLSRIQFTVGLTSHLHTIILHTTRALANIFNLYNNAHVSFLYMARKKAHKDFLVNWNGNTITYETIDQWLGRPMWAIV